MHRLGSLECGPSIYNVHRPLFQDSKKGAEELRLLGSSFVRPMSVLASIEVVGLLILRPEARAAGAEYNSNSYSCKMLQDVGRCTKKANTQHRSEKDMQGDKRNKQNKQDD